MRFLKSSSFVHKSLLFEKQCVLEIMIMHSYAKKKQRVKAKIQGHRFLPTRSTSFTALTKIDPHKIKLTKRREKVLPSRTKVFFGGKKNKSFLC